MKEEEIRPHAVFDEYLRLAALDSEKYFAEHEMQAIRCPACGDSGVPQFVKHRFTYECCPACDTLFVSPRPPAGAFQCYYRESESARFFATTFYKLTATARREKLWRPKAERVREALIRRGAAEYSVIDIGGGYGIFASEYQAIAGSDVTVIEPGPELARICRESGLRVIEEFLEKIAPDQLGQGPKAFVSFELFEHLHDPEHFLTQLTTLMRPGDLFIFTTLSGVGVDIQALWENSKAISLQHLNFFNPRSIRLLLERTGLAVTEVTTPGQLDIDILANNKEQIRDRFWRTFVDHASREERDQWQLFVAEQGWSSHMSVVCEYRERI